MTPVWVTVIEQDGNEYPGLVLTEHDARKQSIGGDIVETPATFDVRVFTPEGELVRRGLQMEHENHRKHENQKSEGYRLAKGRFISSIRIKGSNSAPVSKPSPRAKGYGAT